MAKETIHEIAIVLHYWLGMALPPKHSLKSNAYAGGIAMTRISNPSRRHRDPPRRSGDPLEEETHSDL